VRHLRALRRRAQVRHQRAACARARARAARRPRISGAACLRRRGRRGRSGAWRRLLRGARGACSASPCALGACVPLGDAGCSRAKCCNSTVPRCRYTAVVWAAGPVSLAAGPARQTTRWRTRLLHTRHGITRRARGPAPATAASATAAPFACAGAPASSPAAPPPPTDAPVPGTTTNGPAEPGGQSFVSYERQDAVRPMTLPDRPRAWLTRMAHTRLWQLADGTAPAVPMHATCCALPVHEPTAIPQPWTLHPGARAVQELAPSGGGRARRARGRTHGQRQVAGRRGRVHAEVERAAAGRGARLAQQAAGRRRDLARGHADRQRVRRGRARRVHAGEPRARPPRLRAPGPFSRGRQPQPRPCPLAHADLRCPAMRRRARRGWAAGRAPRGRRRRSVPARAASAGRAEDSVRQTLSRHGCLERACRGCAACRGGTPGCVMAESARAAARQAAERRRLLTRARRPAAPRPPSARTRPRSTGRRPRRPPHTPRRPRAGGARRGRPPP